MHRSIVGCLVLFAVPAFAQEPLDLPALLAEADRAHPELLAQAERAAAASEAAVRAGALPDPRLYVSYTNDGLSDFTLGESPFSSVTARWEQEVPRDDARKLAAEVARREQGVSLAGAERLRARLRARVITAYAAIWRAERLQVLVQEGRAALATSLEAGRARYEAGDGPQEAVLRIQTEVRRADLELEGLVRERRAAEIDLTEALGRRHDARFASAGPLPAVLTSDLEALEAAAVASGPESLSARAELERADAVVAHAREGAKPEWGWMAAYQYLGSLDPMVMGGVMVRLPLWSSSKQSRAIAEGERQVEAARRSREAVENETAARVRDLVSEITSLDRRIAIYEGALLPEGEAALAAARAAFSSGQAGMTLVIDDLGRLLADRRAAADLAARRLQTTAGLEAITGARLVAVAEMGGGR